METAGSGTVKELFILVQLWTKSRRALLSPPVIKTLNEAVRSFCKEQGYYTLDVIAMANNIIVLFIAPSDVSIDSVVKLLKDYTTRVLFEAHPELKGLSEGELWDEDYYLSVAPYTEKLVYFKRPERLERIEFFMLYQKLNDLTQDFELFKEKHFKPLKQDVADLKGDNFERKVRENAPSYLGKLVKNLKFIDKYDLAQILDSAVDKGLITDENRNFAMKVDFVGKGKLKDSKEDVYIALEVTVSLHNKDIEKVLKRADIITKAVGQKTIPVIIYKKANSKMLSLAKERGVYTLIASED